jgi:hypothetical protein
MLIPKNNFRGVFQLQGGLLLAEYNLYKNFIQIKVFPLTEISPETDMT